MPKVETPLGYASCWLSICHADVLPLCVPCCARSHGPTSHLHPGFPRTAARALGCGKTWPTACRNPDSLGRHGHGPHWAAETTRPGRECERHVFVLLLSIPAHEPVVPCHVPRYAATTAFRSSSGCTTLEPPKPVRLTPATRANPSSSSFVIFTLP